MSQVMYQVTAECVYATVASPYGVTRQLLLKGALIPGDAPEIEHLVTHGLVAKVDGQDDTGVNAVGTVGVAETDQGAAGSVVSSTPVQQPDPDAEAERRRTEARAKLPADGSAPHANSSEAVWVEYAVSKGMDRAAAESAGKDEIRKALADQK